MCIKKIIVGEKFNSFIVNHGEVWGIGEFLEKMESGRLDRNITYILGQGISVWEKKRILKLLKENPDVTVKLNQKKEKRMFVHKHKEQNVMITKPLPWDKNKYRSFLSLDDECAEMSDHVTGQHIQGMVLIEAARQMMLSVTENYFLKSDQGNAWIIINELNVNFSNFLFPVDIEISYEVEKIKSNKHGTQYHAMVLFQQKNKKSASITIKYSTYNKAWLASKEAGLANEVLSLLTTETINV